MLCQGSQHTAAAPCLTELRRKWFEEASKCSLPDSEAAGKGRLSMHQAWSVFLVLAAGAAIAVLVAMLEVIFYKKFFSGLWHDSETSDSCGIGLGPVPPVAKCLGAVVT